MIVVYGIKYMFCDKIIYVLESWTTRSEQFQKHISSIRRSQQHPVSEHFNLDNKSVEDLRVVCVEKVKHNDIHLIYRYVLRKS